jgi:phosphonate transport system substrate-binding protein
VADGAAVDSLVLQYALQRDPTLKERVKIIHQSPPFGIPPVVVPPQASPRLKAELRQLLVNMPNDPEGRRILAGLGFDGFAVLGDESYDTARQIIQATGVKP